MDEKIETFFSSQVPIPEEVLTELTLNRSQFSGIAQEAAPHSKRSISKKMSIIIGLAAMLGLSIVLTQTPVIAVIETALGINQDAAVKVVEEQGIPTKLNLSSVQNGREITVTKFVSTKKKMAFDYQFKIDDPMLKTILEKTGENKARPADVMLGLFAEGNPKNLFGGVFYSDAYYIKDGIYHGSVDATFVSQKIPKNAKLTLHIYSLAWTDRERVRPIIEKAEAEGSTSFSIGPADVKYEGDWQFKINYQPILTTRKPKISKTVNVSEISAVSDALQTTIKFKGTSLTPGTTPDVVVYRNGVKLAPNSLGFGGDGYDTWFDLSALDKSKATYKIELIEYDDKHNGKVIGSFELK